jgi:hypothetical protein
LLNLGHLGHQLPPIWGLRYRRGKEGRRGEEDLLLAVLAGMARHATLVARNIISPLALVVVDLVLWDFRLQRLLL